MIKGKLPGLNGLRAIAASLVLFIHSFQLAGDFYGDSFAKKYYWDHRILGTNMVNLFFVISGFIITYILFQEKERTGTVSLKFFYIKRVLRIWPLYFGIIAMVLLLSRYTNWYDIFSGFNGSGFLMLALFLTNFQIFISGTSISVLPHYWSLSIEEQFYLFWPAIFKFLKGRKLLLFPLSIVVGIILARGGVVLLNRIWPSEFLFKIMEVLSDSKFGSISIGVISACLLHNKHRWLKYIFNSWVQTISWLVLLGTIFSTYKFPYIHFEVASLFYAIIILNVTSNTKPVFRLKNKFLDITGQISYGIYMFHWPIIPLLIGVIKYAGLWEFSQRNYQIPLLVISFSVTWVIAWLSFNYFETFFLKLRPRNKTELT